MADQRTPEIAASAKRLQAWFQHTGTDLSHKLSTLSNEVSHRVTSAWHQWSQSSERAFSHRQPFTLERLPNDLTFEDDDDVVLVWLLGQPYLPVPLNKDQTSVDLIDEAATMQRKPVLHFEASADFRSAFHSIPWMTYRSGFERIVGKSQTLTSDVGWGCMLR